MQAREFKRFSEALTGESQENRRIAQSFGFYFLNLTQKQHEKLYKMCFDKYPHDALTGEIILDNGLRLCRPEKA